MCYRTFLILIMVLIGCGDKSTGPDQSIGPNHEEGDLVVDLPNGSKMAFIWIEPGTFIMGAPESEEGRSTFEGPQHQVTLTKGYYLGKYEVTQGQWMQVMGTQPWGSEIDSIGSDFPALRITWRGAQDFMAKLNAQTDGAIYRLPTEAEWEHACRAGTNTSWFFGRSVNSLSEYAWWDGNVDGPQKVGGRLANPWRIYDLYGNAYEWTQDWWAPYASANPQIDPQGASEVVSQTSQGFYTEHVIRGGGYNTPAQQLRSAARFQFFFPQIYREVGFRVLREDTSVLSSQ